MPGRIRLTEDQIASALGRLQGWAVVDGKLHKEFKFRDFALAFGFMAAAAPTIEKRDHHPEWCNVYDRVTVNLTTHDAGGITQLDIELAELLQEIGGRLQ